MRSSSSRAWGSGSGSLLIAIAIGERLPGAVYIVAALILGFIAYGLSIFLYIYAQRFLGAARTSAYYAIAPFIGVLLAWVIFREASTAVFLLALAFMLAGVFLASDMGTGHEKRM